MGLIRNASFALWVAGRWKAVAEMANRRALWWLKKSREWM